MQFIFDHILAFLIASVVIMIVVANQMRTMESGMEDTSTYIAKNNSLDLAEMIEDDLNMTLHRYDTGRSPFTWPITQDADGRTTSFSFYRDSLNTLGQTVRLFSRYRLQFSDSLQTNVTDSTGTTVVTQPLFEVIREECSTISPTVPCVPVFAGNSAPWVSDFRVAPLRIDKSPAVSLAESHYLQISFIMNPPYRTERQIVDKLHWSTLLQVQPF